MKRGSGMCVFAGLLGLSLWSLLPGGVRPPQSVTDPVTVRLISAGRHSGLLLPAGDGRVVEYGYGDWSWYALGKDDWWRAPATVLWPCPGTLGRRYWREADLAAMGETRGFDHVADFTAERRDVRRLLARLDADFAAGGPPLHSDQYGMDFVRSAERFWFAHDCHDETAEWLRELGCFVPPVPIRISLRVKSPRRLRRPRRSVVGWRLVPPTPVSRPPGTTRQGVLRAGNLEDSVASSAPHLSRVLRPRERAVS